MEALQTSSDEGRAIAITTQAIRPQPLALSLIDGVLRQ